MLRYNGFVDIESECDWTVCFHAGEDFGPSLHIDCVNSFSISRALVYKRYKMLLWRRYFLATMKAFWSAMTALVTLS